MTRKALIAAIQQFFFNNVWIIKCLRRLFDHSTFSKTLERFLKVIDCTQQLQVRENVMGFEKELGVVKVIKDQIQYRSQSLLNLAHSYFSNCLKPRAFSENHSSYLLTLSNNIQGIPFASKTILI